MRNLWLRKNNRLFYNPDEEPGPRSGHKGGLLGFFPALYIYKEAPRARSPALGQWKNRAKLGYIYTESLD